MLDIIEFENMDVIMISGEHDENNSEPNIFINSVNLDDRLSEEPTHEPDENAETEGTTHGSEGSTDEPVLSEETSAPQEPELDTDETDTQAEQQPDDGGLS